MKSEFLILILMLLAALFTIFNSFFHWINDVYAVMIMNLLLVLYIIWEKRYGNKT